MNFTRTMRALMVAPALCLMAGAALAQSYPNKPVRLVLPYSPDLNPIEKYWASAW